MIEEKFREVFGRKGKFVHLRSPGRVNLIGEHTDYNQGFVFPCAVDLEIHGVALPRDDSKVRIFSYEFGETGEFDIGNPAKTDDSWINYAKGVAVELNKIAGLKHGVDVVYKSSLPVGSGLSSSACFELINAMLFSHVNGTDISRKDLALLCQRAENKFVGVNCGIMDQFSIALAKKDSALFLDTKSFEYDNVALNLGEYRIVISNTNKSRTLAGSAYNTRRKECESAVEILKRVDGKINSLRDVSVEMLENNKSLLPEIIYKRAKHVVGENQRVLDSVKKLKAGNLQGFAGLMKYSHDSLRELYEVSSFELDTMVEESLKIDGVIGSRMTGAGFGGCTVSIVRKNVVDKFKEIVGRNYREKTELNPEFYVTNSVDGIEIK